LTEVRFYHLQRQRLEDALPALLEKVRLRGHRAVVQATSTERVRLLDALLWTWCPETFLPHASSASGNPIDQPIWLTDREERPNEADLLVLIDGAEADLSPYAMCCDMFDGRDENAVIEARRRWAVYKEAGHTVTYWQQGENGWEKQA
jgi:DNA polymerase-3 subunit chi